MKFNATPNRATPGEKHDVRAGQSLELLKALHILTRDGKLNQDSRRKLKQVYHLFNFIEPLLQKIQQARGKVTLVDHGAGKSYLGFILYDLYFKPQAKPDGSIPGRVIGVEIRDDLVQRSAGLAQQFGFGGMEFLNLSVAASEASTHIPETIDIVTALHACDTATDDAIAFGLKHRVQHLVLVPCCQAEVAATLNANRSQPNIRSAGNPMAELWRHPIHTREFGSQLTNVMRCLQLEAHGYQVSVTELIGWEHSMKNELIIASRKTMPREKSHDRDPALRLYQVLGELGLGDHALAKLKQRFFVPTQQSVELVVGNRDKESARSRYRPQPE